MLNPAWVPSCPGSQPRPLPALPAAPSSPPLPGLRPDEALVLLTAFQRLLCLSRSCPVSSVSTSSPGSEARAPGPARSLDQCRRSALKSSSLVFLIKPPPHTHTIKLASKGLTLGGPVTLSTHHRVPSTPDPCGVAWLHLALRGRSLICPQQTQSSPGTRPHAASPAAAASRCTRRCSRSPCSPAAQPRPGSGRSWRS